MRENLIRRDLVECVLGLGPGLFYNAPMEACVVVCRTQKTKSRKGRFLFIDGINEIARERSQSFLKQEHQSRVLAESDSTESDGQNRLSQLLPRRN